MKKSLLQKSLLVGAAFSLTLGYAAAYAQSDSDGMMSDGMSDGMMSDDMGGDMMSDGMSDGMMSDGMSGDMMGDDHSHGMGDAHGDGMGDMHGDGMDGMGGMHGDGMAMGLGPMAIVVSDDSAANFAISAQFANMGLEQGRRVQFVLVGDGQSLAASMGMQDDLPMMMGSPREFLAAFIEMGGDIFVCSDCDAMADNLMQANFIDGALLMPMAEINMSLGANTIPVGEVTF